MSDWPIEREVAIHGSHPNGGLVFPLIDEGTYHKHASGEWEDEWVVTELGPRVARRFRLPDITERYVWRFPVEMRHAPTPTQGALSL